MSALGYLTVGGRIIVDKNTAPLKKTCKTPPLTPIPLSGIF
jgi:hypothetical protein